MKRETWMSERGHQTGERAEALAPARPRFTPRQYRFAGVMHALAGCFLVGAALKYEPIVGGLGTIGALLMASVFGFYAVGSWKRARATA